ncbi:MAG TPA: hypothetical protein VH744_05780, partial [Terriglobales bacterium]
AGFDLLLQGGGVGGRKGRHFCHGVLFSQTPAAGFHGAFSNRRMSLKAGSEATRRQASFL